MKRIAYLIFILSFFSSCEKTINFQPKDSTPLLVVEANIESGQPPLVVLSKSVNYFSKITPQLLQTLSITDTL